MLGYDSTISHDQLYFPRSEHPKHNTFLPLKAFCAKKTCIRIMANIRVENAYVSIGLLSSFDFRAGIFECPDLRSSVRRGNRGALTGKGRLLRALRPQPSRRRILGQLQGSIAKWCSFLMYMAMSPVY